jgi:hypothetical protein
MIVIRPRRIRLATIPVAVLIVVTCVVAAILLRDTPTGVIFGIADQVAMVGIGVLVAGGVLLPLRPRIRADADGIEVRNVFSTQRLDWQVVEAVSFPDGAPWARIELPDDEYVPATAIQAADREYAVTAVRELRALHRASAGSAAQQS